MSPISFGTQYIYFYTCPQGGSDDDGRSNDFMGVKLVLQGREGREGCINVSYGSSIFAPYGAMLYGCEACPINVSYGNDFYRRQGKGRFCAIRSNDFYGREGCPIFGFLWSGENRPNNCFL